MNRPSSNHVRPPKFSNSEIIEKAERLSKQYAMSVEPELALLATSFDAVYENVIYPNYGIELIETEDLGHDDDGQKILGEYCPLTNKAYIDVSLHPKSKDPRRAFTCWHEVGGHGVLQGDWLRKEMRRIGADRRIVTTEDSLDLTTSNILERQANLFASHAGAPTWLLNHAIRETYRITRPIRYCGPRRYCLDVNGHCQYYHVASFNDFCRVIALNIQWRFGWLSIEAMSYRIEASPFVIDETNRSFGLRRTAKTRIPRTLTAAAFPTTTMNYAGVQ